MSPYRKETSIHFPNLLKRGLYPSLRPENVNIRPVDRRVVVDGWGAHADVGTGGQVNATNCHPSLRDVSLQRKADTWMNT